MTDTRTFLPIDVDIDKLNEYVDMFWHSSVYIDGELSNMSSIDSN